MGHPSGCSRESILGQVWRIKLLFVRRPRRANEDARIGEQQIKLDAQQFVEVLRAVGADKKSIWSPSSLLQLAQFFAILVAGLWAFFEYKSFRSENEQLTLNQQRFAIEQQAITREQQALSLEMAQATLAL